MDLPAILLPNAEQLRLDSLTVASARQTLILTLTATQTTCPCPLCGTTANRVHSHYIRTIRDLPWAGVTVELRLRARKFFCDAPECPRRIFTERIPTVVAPRARATVRFTVAQQRIGLALGGAAGERLALDLAFPSGIDSLLRSVRAAPLPSTSPPEQIGIDDWAKRKGQTYATIIVDLTTRQPIDMLPERSAESVATWLQAHPSVQLISRDRASLYAEGARQGVPDAVQVADRWHILKNLGEAVLQVLQHHHHAINQALTPTAPSAPLTPATASVPASPNSATQPSSSTSSALPPPLSRAEQKRQQRRER
jgi:transposase